MTENVNDYNENMWDEGRTKTVRQSTQKPDFNEENYLNTRLKPGETKRETKIRIILTKDIDGRDKVAIPVEVHSLKLNKDQSKLSKSGFKSFICLNDSHIEGVSNGCPLCEKKSEIFAEINSDKKLKKELIERISKETNADVKVKLESELSKLPTDEELKARAKEAYKYETKTAYIVRCIERGHEDEGVKFWRFNKRDDKSGIFDELKNMAENRMRESEEAGMGRYNMYNYEDGLDLTLTMTQAEKKTPGAPDKTAIKIDAASIRTPLSKNKELAELWINDTKDWRDMYRSKSYDYLKIVADGKNPVFSQKEGKYVAWVDMENANAQAEKEAVSELREIASVNNDDDELPF